MSIVLSGSAAAGVYGAASVGIIIDDNGNVGVVYGASVGGGTPSAGAGVQLQITNADTIWDTKGVGFEVGGSILGFGVSYVGGKARDGSYVHGVGISPTNVKNMNFGKLESALNAAFKTGNTLQKVSSVGKIGEFHGAVTFTGVYSNLSRDTKKILRSLVRNYYVSMTCSAFRYAAEMLLDIDI